jgi:hypothetical protein
MRYAILPPCRKEIEKILGRDIASVKLFGAAADRFRDHTLDELQAAGLTEKIKGITTRLPMIEYRIELKDRKLRVIFSIDGAEATWLACELEKRGRITRQAKERAAGRIPH